MPNGTSVPDQLLVPTDVQALPPGAQRLAEALRTGNCPADRLFDRFLPDDLRAVSGQYWTPLLAARRAAEWLDDVGVHTVVDIGSGAGKFCVVAALVGNCRVIGLEQRPSLVAAARTLSEAFKVQDRVTFLEGALGVVPTPHAEAYYLYNPFGHYCFDSDRYADSGVAFSDARVAHDVAAAERLLAHAPIGTYVITYNGFGGRVPATYRLLRADQKLPCTLRLWRKDRCPPRFPEPIERSAEGE